MIHPDDHLNHIRNKGGYTSWTSDMGVQWDWRDNCSKSRYRNPPVPMRYIRLEYPPSFQACCRERSPHEYIKGDLGVVCKKCGLFVNSGRPVPVFGDLKGESKRFMVPTNEVLDYLRGIASVVNFQVTRYQIRHSLGKSNSETSAGLALARKRDEIFSPRHLSRSGDVLYGAYKYKPSK